MAPSMAARITRFRLTPSALARASTRTRSWRGTWIVVGTNRNIFAWLRGSRTPSHLGLRRTGTTATCHTAAMRLAIAALLFSTTASAATTSENAAKYQALRARLASEFIVVGDAPGMSQPADERIEPQGIIRWSDSSIGLGCVAAPTRLAALGGLPLTRQRAPVEVFPRPPAPCRWRAPRAWGRRVAPSLDRRRARREASLRDWCAVASVPGSRRMRVIAMTRGHLEHMNRHTRCERNEAGELRERSGGDQYQPARMVSRPTPLCCATDRRIACNVPTRRLL